MKSIDEFLSELRHLEIQLWVEDERLRYKAPKGTLTPDLLQVLKARKTEIIAYLQPLAPAEGDVSLVPIQPKGSKPPLFCIYGICIYYDLARYLGEDQPVYGIYIQDEVDLQDNQSEQPGQQSLSVADLAARYLQQMRKQQPTGPYFLTGLSFGGLVAFEIAQQLRAQGEQVSLLALLDTTPPGGYPAFSSSQRLLIHLKSVLQHGHAYIWAKAQGRVALEKNKILNSLNKISLEHTQAGDLKNYLKQKVDFFTRASKTYVAKPYSGRIILFEAQYDNHFRSRFSSSRWQQLALDGLEVHEIPGDHFGILKEPHVQILAAKFSYAIEQALSDPSLEKRSSDKAFQLNA
jgi:thioesterase domain-containing protein